MKQNRQTSISLIVLAAGLFLVTGLLFPGSSTAERRQSQSSTTVCNDETGTCTTTICADGQPCHSTTNPPLGTASPLVSSTPAVQEPAEEAEQPTVEQEQTSEQAEEQVEPARDTQDYIAEQIPVLPTSEDPIEETTEVDEFEAEDEEDSEEHQSLLEEILDRYY
jgi:type IV secretory pathway VirB10-like protein